MTEWGDKAEELHNVACRVNHLFVKERYTNIFIRKQHVNVKLPPPSKRDDISTKLCPILLSQQCRPRAPPQVL